VGSKHLYALGSRDRFANRAVNTDTLFQNRRDALVDYRKRALEVFGLHYQMRVAVYDRSQFLGICAAIRARADGDYSQAEVDRFDAIVPALTNLLACLRLVGTQPLCLSTIAAVLDAFLEPAFLVAENGAVAVANRAARTAYTSLPDWVQSRSTARIADNARVVQLALDGRLLWLVVSGRPTRPLELAALSPRLRQVAHLLAQGLPDKEISCRMGLSLVSTRTYVTRLFRRLGVHSRVELLTRLRDASGESGAL
jgi:DNA-binding CsgD family transcriptional regulator